MPNKRVRWEVFYDGTVHNVSQYADGSWFLCVLWDGDTDTDDCIPFAEVTKV